MSARTIVFAILAVFLASSPSWAMGGGGGGGTGVAVPTDLLLPGAPLHVVASSSDGMATITFDPPKSDGGSHITRYTVTSHPGGIMAKGARSPIVIRGLINGKEYNFTVNASNSVGTGLPSEPSNSVVPSEQ